MDITFILGILSLIQICFLPGFLILKTLNLNGFLKIMILSFGLSLTVNHFLVFGLTALHLYKPVILYSIFGLELLFLTKILIYQKVLLLSLPETNIIQEFKSSDLLNSILKIIIYLGCFAVVILFLVYTIANIGNIFHTGDDVASWNRWALDWARNIFPVETWHYPQMLPINWSISYVFMHNSSIQFFAKFIMPLFPLFTLLLMLELALTTKKAEFFISVISTGLIIESLCSKSTVQSGYADLAVAFFAFSSIYCLLKARFTLNKNEIIKYFFLGAAFCIGASVTKQAGFYIEFLYPIFAYLLVFKNSELIKNSDKIKLIVLSLIMMVTFSSIWYVYKEIQIAKGLDSSEVEYVTSGIYQGKTYLERFVAGFDMFKAKFGSINIYFVFLFMFLSVFNPLTRWFFPLIVLPFTLIWSILFSYDIRNVTLAMPFMGLCYGFGLNLIIEKLKFIRIEEMNPFKDSLKEIKIHKLAVLIITGIIFITLNLLLPGKYLLNVQADKELKFIGKTSIKR